MSDNNNKRTTGRKPGHNASSKGFVASPPVKPVAPTAQNTKITFPSSIDGETLVDLNTVLAVFSPKTIMTGLKVGCDKCGVRTEETFTSMKQVKEDVITLGWTIKNNEFFCPKCSA